MCSGDTCGDKTVSRRSLVAGASLALSGIVSGGEAGAQQPPTQALENPDVAQRPVSFPCGGDTMQGYLAHPKKEGRHRAVIVLHGDFGMPELARYTAAMLAENGFAALAYARFARVPGLTREALIQSDRTEPTGAFSARRTTNRS
jgi:carboxymethylenebutenolidase